MIEMFVLLIITAGALNQSVRHLDVLFDSSVICTSDMHEFDGKYMSHEDGGLLTWPLRRLQDRS